MVFPLSLCVPMLLGIIRGFFSSVGKHIRHTLQAESCVRRKKNIVGHLRESARVRVYECCFPSVLSFSYPKINLKPLKLYCVSVCVCAKVKHNMCDTHMMLELEHPQMAPDFFPILMKKKLRTNHHILGLLSSLVEHQFNDWKNQYNHFRTNEYAHHVNVSFWVFEGWKIPAIDQLI